MLETKEQVRFYGAEVQPRFLAVLSPWKIVGVDKVGDMRGRYLMAIRLNVLGVPMVIAGLVVDPAALTSASDPLQMVADAANLSTTVRGTTGERFTDVDAVMRGEIHGGRGQTERTPLRMAHSGMRCTSLMGTFRLSGSLRLWSDFDALIFHHAQQHHSVFDHHVSHQSGIFPLGK